MQIFATEKQGLFIEGATPIDDKKSWGKFLQPPIHSPPLVRTSITPLEAQNRTNHITYRG